MKWKRRGDEERGKKGGGNRVKIWLGFEYWYWVKDDEIWPSDQRWPANRNAHFLFFLLSRTHPFLIFLKLTTYSFIHFIYFDALQRMYYVLLLHYSTCAINLYQCTYMYRSSRNLIELLVWSPELQLD